MKPLGIRINPHHYSKCNISDSTGYNNSFRLNSISCSIDRYCSVGKITSWSCSKSISRTNSTKLPISRSVVENNKYGY